MNTENTTYRFALDVVGKDGDPVNLMYFGMLAVGIIGALFGRFQPRGMARALFATALAQVLVVVVLRSICVKESTSG